MQSVNRRKFQSKRVSTIACVSPQAFFPFCFFSEYVRLQRVNYSKVSCKSHDDEKHGTSWSMLSFLYFYFTFL